MYIPRSLEINARNDDGGKVKPLGLLELKINNRVRNTLLLNHLLRSRVNHPSG
jgi:hypothetical protein